MAKKQISDLIRMDFPEDVLKEVLVILDMISPGCNTTAVNSAFDQTMSLFTGNFSGYQACNTEYHDITHTTNTFIAMARLIHGAVLQEKIFTDRQISLGLIAALLHDTGYIQEKCDRQGTGAKYTTSHVKRSMDFLEKHGAGMGLSGVEIISGRAMILCTDLAVDIHAITFPTLTIELLGKLLGAADLLAQMADRTYLEKLLFLYYEFKEARIGGFESQVDLLKKTVGFYDFITKRLETALDSSDRFMISHFISRWGIHENLYHVSIENQKNYLQQILNMQHSNPLNHLKRNGIVKTVLEKHKI